MRGNVTSRQVHRTGERKLIKATKGLDNTGVNVRTDLPASRRKARPTVGYMLSLNRRK